MRLANGLSRLALAVRMAALLAILLIGCSRADREPSPTPLSTLRATDPSGPSGPTTTPVTPATPVSVQRLMEIGEQVFPVQPSGVYGVCGADGNLQACPYTDRLQNRLREASATLCRCQNPSVTRAMSAEVADFGGVLYVALFNGSQSYMLTIVNQDGRLLVDDQSCLGRGAATSIHLTVAPC